jgi:hypothetical protein
MVCSWITVLCSLTLILLMWKIRRAPNNAGKWQMGCNLALKWLNTESVGAIRGRQAFWRLPARNTAVTFHLSAHMHSAVFTALINVPLFGAIVLQITTQLSFRRIHISLYHMPSRFSLWTLRYVMRSTDNSSRNTSPSLSKQHAMVKWNYRSTHS